MNAMMPDKTNPMPNSEQPSKPFDKLTATMQAVLATEDGSRPEDLQAILDSMEKPNADGGK